MTRCAYCDLTLERAPADGPPVTYEGLTWHRACLAACLSRRVEQLRASLAERSPNGHTL